MLVDDYCHYTAYVSTQGLQPPNSAAAVLGRQLLEVQTLSVLRHKFFDEMEASMGHSYSIAGGCTAK